MSRIDDMITKVTDAASDLINFDDMDISTIKSYAEKFGVWDNITGMLPAEMSAKLADGTLTKEELMSVIPDLKDMIMSKIGGGADHASTEEQA